MNAYPFQDPQNVQITLPVHSPLLRLSPAIVSARLAQRIPTSFSILKSLVLPERTL